MKRPTALTAVAVLIVVMGIAGMVSGGNVGFWNVLNVVAGIGLLRYSNGWRRYVLFTTWFSLVMLVPCCVFAMLHPEQIVVKFPAILIDQRDHAVIPRLWLAVMLTGYTALFVWVVRTLMRHDVRHLFQLQRA